MEHICSPNLPKNRVKQLVIGEKYAFLAEQLEKMGIIVHLLPEITEVDSRLSGHVDLAVLTCGRECCLSATAEASIGQKFKENGYIVRKLTIKGSDYPDDCVLNACVMGEYIIHNKEFSVLRDKPGFIHVRQGYAKCNICPVTDNALITSDAGIANACRAKGIDVLQIAVGGIELQGFDTGFIGGAAFKLSENLLAFTGDIRKHPDAELVIEFLKKYNIEYICLTQQSLFDIGSAVLMTEE